MPDNDFPADAPSAAAPPTVATYGWPTWLRRTLITLALIGCAGLLYWGGHRSDAGKTPKDADPAIVRQYPPPGGTALSQATVGVELRSGYDGRLVINGIAIPEAQMEGARDPATVDPKDLKENGLRPNNRNHVAFTPGPGKVIEKLPEGTIYVSVQYFPERRNHDAGRTIDWTFNSV